MRSYLCEVGECREFGAFHCLDLGHKSSHECHLTDHEMKPSPRYDKYLFRDGIGVCSTVGSVRVAMRATRGHAVL